MTSVVLAFDPETEKIDEFEGGHLFRPRFGHATAMVSGKTLMVVGGESHGDRFLNSTEIFNETLGRFVAIGPGLSVQRSDVCGAAVGAFVSEVLQSLSYSR